MRKIVVLTGAGVSAESGLKTFRDTNGLWRTYRLEEMASPEAWHRDPALVLEFYNIRRKQLLEVEPNPAHYALVKLEQKYDVRIVTQNVDDLHERAGSKSILHIHGELRKSRSTADASSIYDINGWELKLGDKCEKGSQLRPHIVWFGEPVDMIVPAAGITRSADMVIVIGTSLAVFPAAGLIYDVPDKVPKFYIDPNAHQINGISNLTAIAGKAAEEVPKLVEKLLAL
jgi:NAD-dependent deacetylase